MASTNQLSTRFPFSILHLNDGDGLENSVDPDPLTPGNDAHGTNTDGRSVRDRLQLHVMLEKCSTVDVDITVLRRKKMKMRNRLGMMAVGLGVLAGSLCGSVADGDSVRSNVFEKVRAVFCETQQIFTISANGDYKAEKKCRS